MSNVMVSIYVPTFNHENYIARALDSIVMQRTEYSYEILVGEDCSTDNTRQVLKNWEREHPQKATVFYREQNMHGSECSNAMDLKKRCRGKYIICLEGDDFWTDPEKLQKQVEFLENHPEYYAVAHNCVVVGAYSEPNGETYPECKDTEYTFRHFASDILPGQYTTLLARNYMTDPGFDRTLAEVRVGPGDRNVYFSILCHGRIYCMQEVMSAYRHVTSGGSSFSATNRYRYESEELACRLRMEYAHSLGCADAVKYAEMLYLRNVRYALRTGKVDKQTAGKDKARIQNRTRASLLLLKRDVNYRILRKTVHV